MKKKLLASFSLGLGLLFINCEEVFYETDISDAMVTLLAPANNSELNAGTHNFYWEGVEDADSYRIQIATPTFESATAIVLDSVMTDSISPKTSITKDLSANEYQWRVKAMNSISETVFSTHSFSIDPNISEVEVTIIAPVANAELTAGEQVFSWEAVADADEYSVQIVTPSFENPTETLLDITTAETEVSKELVAGTYQWRVKAVNSISETTYITTTFTVKE